MKTQDLDSRYSIYGNKGTVWGNKAHIVDSQRMAKGKNGTLCGTPMLATNWAREEKMPEANCPKCNEIYSNRVILKTL